MDGNGSGRVIAPFGQSFEDMGLAKDLTGFDKKVGDGDNRTTLRKLFLTLSDFIDTNESDAYATGMHRCLKYQMWDELEELVLRVMARVSVKRQGRHEIIDVLTQIQMIREEAERDRRKSARKPQQANV